MSFSCNADELYRTVYVATRMHKWADCIIYSKQKFITEYTDFDKVADKMYEDDFERYKELEHDN